MLKPSFLSVLALQPTAISAQVVAPPASAVFDKYAVHEGSGHWYNEGPACTEGLTPVRGYRIRQRGSTRHFSIPGVVDQDAIVFEGGAQRLVQRDARRDVSDRGREFLGLRVRQIALLLGHRERRGGAQVVLLLFACKELFLENPVVNRRIVTGGG